MRLLTFCAKSSDDDLNKPDIIDALDGFLQTNSSRLQHDPTFEPFFLTRRTPHKARDNSNSDEGEVKSVVRGRGRRATKVKSEPEYDRHPATPQSQSN